MPIEPANAVSVRALGKSYPLYRAPRDRLKEAFHPFGKQYHHKFNALDDVSIDVPRGLALGIIGRNGSGKSTLLQCICGIVQPTAGAIEVNGKIAALLELGAGFNPEFSGRDNLYLNAAILGLSREEIDQRLDRILAFADIGEYIDQPVRAYSSGMYVRLAFAIAIHVDPEILIVDEALAVGDIHFQAKCFERFRQFRERGVTVIFVTHDLNLVTRYCDQAILLSHGKIVARGNPREVVAEYRKLEANHLPAAAEISEQGPVGGGNLQSALFAANPYEVRYGNKKAVIADSGIYDLDGNPLQILDSGETYLICMQVEFSQPLVEPVFAFTIKDARGTEIAGTNTRFSNIETGSFSAGDRVTVEFSQRLPLTAGSFLLSVGCVSLGADQVEVHDRRHDYLSFQVLSNKDTVGIVDLDSAVTIKHRSKG